MHDSIKTHPGLSLIACALAGDDDTNARTRSDIQQATTHDAAEVFGQWLGVWRELEGIEGIPLNSVTASYRIPADRLSEVTAAIDGVVPGLWADFVKQARTDRDWRWLEKVALRLTDAAQNRQGDPAALLEGLTGGDECRKPSEVHDSRNLCRLLVDDLEARINLRKSGKRSGIATGLSDLDRMTDGLQLGELAIIGARPSTGKTALACSIVSSCCLGNLVPTVFLSLESSACAITRRLAAVNSGVRLRTMRDGSTTEADARSLTTFQHRLKAAPIHIIDGRHAANIDVAISELSRLIRKHGVKLVMIDYVQKLKASGRHEKLTYGIGEVTNRLQAFAQKHGVAVLALAQLNREPDKDKGRLPRMADLADSAQIERDADLIALLHRPRDKDHDGSDATLFISKQRDGEVGPVKLRFIGDFARFENPND